MLPDAGDLADFRTKKCSATMGHIRANSYAIEETRELIEVLLFLEEDYRMIRA
jgi:hypothetical protein